MGEVARERLLRLGEAGPWNQLSRNVHGAQGVQEEELLQQRHLTRGEAHWRLLLFFNSIKKAVYLGSHYRDITKHSLTLQGATGVGLDHAPRVGTRPLKWHRRTSCFPVEEARNERRNLKPARPIRQGNPVSHLTITTVRSRMDNTWCGTLIGNFNTHVSIVTSCSNSFRSKNLTPSHTKFGLPLPPPWGLMEGRITTFGYLTETIRITASSQALESPVTPDGSTVVTSAPIPDTVQVQEGCNCRRCWIRGKGAEVQIWRAFPMAESAEPFRMLWPWRKKYFSVYGCDFGTAQESSFWMMDLLNRPLMDNVILNNSQELGKGENPEQWNSC